MAKLLLKHQGVTLSSYKLDQAETSIGRNPDNTIQLDDAAVSGNHARIDRQPNEYLEKHYDFFIEDLGSTNGTKVNSKRVTRQMLKHGDALQIGAHHFIFDSGQVPDLETTAIYLPDED
ncbi:MAG: FHA domain-containing protein [Thiohalomonadales bacterium]|nr:FHA domain-containing protein [Thiohalomonadales bacterium]